MDIRILIIKKKFKGGVCENRFNNIICTYYMYITLQLHNYVHNISISQEQDSFREPIIRRFKRTDKVICRGSFAPKTLCLPRPPSVYILAQFVYTSSFTVYIKIVYIYTLSVCVLVRVSLCVCVCVCIFREGVYLISRYTIPTLREERGIYRLLRSKSTL